MHTPKRTNAAARAMQRRWVRPWVLVPALALLVAGSLPAPAPAQAQPVKIGEINSYSRIPAFTLPYRNGWRLAVKEINAAGGVLGGRKLEVISRDDGGKPGEALTAANELVYREQVVMLVGAFLSNVGLALSNFAKQNEVLYLASEPLTDALVWSQGHRYTFRLRPSTYMQANMLAAQAAELDAKRWASVAPNYEYGTSAVDDFKQLLAERQPGAHWVAEQWPALGKIEAGSTVQALAQAEPDALFNVLFAGDLAKFVREGRLRGLFDDRPVVSLLTGEPEYLDPLGDEAPEGWIVTGYPWYALDTAEHNAFLQAYQAEYGEPPRMGSVVGYTSLQAVAAALDKAGSTDTDALIAAMERLEVNSPFGRIRFRASDHQSTMGAFVGRTAVRDGKGVMVDWHYADGADYLPPPEEVAKLRPAD